MWLHKLKNISIVLASQSPRRAELLRGLGLEFTICTAQVQEIIDNTLSHGAIAESIAMQKVQAVQKQLHEPVLIIGSDTIVCSGEHIYGKPHSREEAVDMLQHLSDNTHSVISSICISYNGKYYTAHDTAYIHFMPLQTDDIAYYVDNYKPYDKAGAYGIQEWIGMRAIDRIEGSFYTVMGFPTHLLCNMVEQIL